MGAARRRSGVRRLQERRGPGQGSLIETGVRRGVGAGTVPEHQVHPQPGDGRDRLAAVTRLRAERRVLRRQIVNDYADRDETLQLPAGLTAKSSSTCPSFAKTGFSRSAAASSRRSAMTIVPYPAAVARQRKHAAWVFHGTLPRPSRVVDSTGIPLGPEPAGARHGRLLRRRQGGRPAEQAGHRRQEVELGDRRPVPRPDVDAASLEGPTEPMDGVWSSPPARHSKWKTDHHAHIVYAFVAVASALGLSVLFSMVECGAAPRRKAEVVSDDPLQREPDTQDASKSGVGDRADGRPHAQPVHRAGRSGAGPVRRTSTRSTRCRTRAGSPTASTEADRRLTR